MTLSIAFLMLIVGFLLGKSTSDRHHSLKVHNRHNVSFNGMFKEDERMKKIEQDLKDIAKEKLMAGFKEIYSDQYLLINNQLKDRFQSCINSTNFDTSGEDLEGILVDLITVQHESFIKCIDDLEKFLKNI